MRIFACEVTVAISMGSEPKTEYPKKPIFNSPSENLRPLYISTAAKVSIVMLSDI